jgi:SAM-dependent methyltransferase
MLMSERNGIYKILRNPAIYTFYQYLVGAPKMHRRFLDECLRLKKGDRILDLGCGPGDFRNYLPDWVEYYGCDPNPAYIAAAKEKLQNAGGGGGGGILIPGVFFERFVKYGYQCPLQYFVFKLGFSTIFG